MTSTMEGGPSSAPAPASPESGTPESNGHNNAVAPEEEAQLVLTGAEKSTGGRWNDRFERWTWKKGEAKKYGFDILNYEDVMVSTLAVKGKKGKPDQPARKSAVDRFYSQFPHRQEPGMPIEIMKFAQREYPIDDSMSPEEVDLQEQRQLKLETILDQGPRAQERIRRNWERYNSVNQGLVYDEILKDQNRSFSEYVDPRLAAREAVMSREYAVAKEYGFNEIDRNEANEAYRGFGTQLGRMSSIDLSDRNSQDAATREAVQQAIIEAAGAYVDQEEYFHVEEGDKKKLAKAKELRREKLIKYLALSPNEHADIDLMWEEYDKLESENSQEEAYKRDKYETLRRMGQAAARSAKVEVMSALSPNLDWAISAHHLRNPKVWSTGATPYARNSKDHTAFEPWGEWNADGTFEEYPEIGDDTDEADSSWSSNSFNEAMNLPATNPDNAPENKGWWSEPSPKQPDFGAEPTPDDDAASAANAATGTYTGTPPWGTQPDNEPQYGPEAPDPPNITIQQLAEQQGWEITPEAGSGEDNSQTPEMAESGNETPPSGNRLSAPYRALERRFGTERAKQIIKLGAAATGVAVAGAGAFWAISRAAARRSR